MKLPPVKVLPSPTDSNMLPALPFVASPVDRRILPVLPDEEVPEANSSDPLTPLLPAFGVFATTNPLDEIVPVPLLRDTNPPVALAADPPVKDMYPPTAAVVLEANPPFI
jgi:hypothetical protein